MPAKWIGVYLIINNVNHKKYVGASNHVLRRFMEHKTPKNIKNGKSPLAEDLRKYGIKKFDFLFLDLVKCETLLPEKEMYWIKKLNPEYNQNEGGLGNKGYKISDEVREIIRQKAKEQWENMTPEQKENQIKNNLTGRGKGWKMTESQKEKLRKVNLGKKQSPETIAKRSKSLKGKLKGNENSNKKIGAFKDGELIKEYKSTKYAAEQFGVHPSCITGVLKGRRKTSCGFKWEYITTKNEE